ncbi:hypothetical protein FHG87_018498 [Trinorchestia longiramus]|nr:hypothetical protein FHG87_018498 [Trinorchestia longiramus]
MSGANKRKFSDEYIKYGFIVIERNGFHLPPCVICHTVLSNDALRPGRLERHSSTNHKALKEKPKEFFTAKLHELNRFSALVVLKTKQHNRLDVENDLRCVLSSFNPRISDLVRKKQQHPSH